MEKDFELLPHTADIKIRVYGTTLKVFFKNALVGMFQSINPKARSCSRQEQRLVCEALPQRRAIDIEGSDREALLVNFLSQALSLSDIYNEAYFDIEIDTMTDAVLKGTLLGVEIQGFEGVEIKAVTYHGLEMKKSDAGWQADIVFDI